MSHENAFVELSDAMAAAVERVGKSTVLVNGRHRMPASGIVYAEGRVLTAEHVLERDEDITVLSHDGAAVKAQVAGRDHGNDLALLRLEKPAGEVAVTAGDKVQVGQLVLALGRPSPEGIQASLGIVSASGGLVRTGRGGLLQHTISEHTVKFHISSVYAKLGAANRAEAVRIGARQGLIVL